MKQRQKVYRILNAQGKTTIRIPNDAVAMKFCVCSGGGGGGSSFGANSGAGGGSSGCYIESKRVPVYPGSFMDVYAGKGGIPDRDGEDSYVKWICSSGRKTKLAPGGECGKSSTKKNISLQEITPIPENINQKSEEVNAIFEEAEQRQPEIDLIPEEVYQRSVQISMLPKEVGENLQVITPISEEVTQKREDGLNGKNGTLIDFSSLKTFSYRYGNWSGALCIPIDLFNFKMAENGKNGTSQNICGGNGGDSGGFCGKFQLTAPRSDNLILYGPIDKIIFGIAGTDMDVSISKDQLNSFSFSTKVNPMWKKKKLVIKGGNGGNGADGINGSTSNGGNGGSSPVPDMENVDYVFGYGGKGGSPGEGLLGTAGGTGGKGGNASAAKSNFNISLQGSLSSKYQGIYVLTFDKFELSTEKCDPTVAGKDGICGKPGEKGEGGIPGEDGKSTIYYRNLEHKKRNSGNGGGINGGDGAVYGKNAKDGLCGASWIQFENGGTRKINTASGGGGGGFHSVGGKGGDGYVELIFYLK